MPRSAKGPQLWLRPARNDDEGRHAAVWIIKDARHQQSTGCLAADLAGAERALEQYLNAKHTAGAKAGGRDPAAIPIADVLNFYAEQVVPKHARPKVDAAAYRAPCRFLQRLHARPTRWRAMPLLHQGTRQNVGSARGPSRLALGDQFSSRGREVRPHSQCGASRETTRARTVAHP